MIEVNFENFQQFKILTGTILKVELNKKALKPAYLLEIDFGKYGTMLSSAQVTENYRPENLKNLQISAVVNFPAKRIAGVKSQVLVLGAYSEEKGVVLLTPTHKVADGSLVG